MRSQLVPGLAIWLAMLAIVLSRGVDKRLRLAAFALMVVEMLVLGWAAFESIRIAGLGR